MKKNRIFLPLLVLLACSHTPRHAERTLPLADKIGPRERFEAFGSNFVISTDGEAASRAGAEIFRLGGNSVDAAVAASFVISVERPHSTGLGGGGFMLVHLYQENKTFAVDFREKAPLKSRRSMFLNKNEEPQPGLSLDGALSSGVPGLVAGLVEVQKRFGKLPLERVIAPSIKLAEEGFSVYDSLARALDERKEVLSRFPSTKKIFFKKESPLKKGDLLVQKDLARTLRAIAKSGAKPFYRGWIAQKIVESQKANSGLIDFQDLSRYDVKWRKPVRGFYQGHEIISMPPPSSGGVHVIEILNLASGFPLANWGAGSPRTVHFIASSMQQAFADRAEYLGDSDFVQVPVERLTSAEYARELLDTIDLKYARPSSAVRPGNALSPEPDHTTHLSVMDSDGNAVTTTQTINGFMGSGLVAAGTGIVMNNEMDDFSIKPGTPNLYGAIGNEKNAVAPQKRPLSSMSPTLVLKNGKPILALGSPSGTRIINCVALTLLNYLTFQMPLFDSIAQIRYHHQWQPNEIRVDEPGFPRSLSEDLELKGHHVRVSNLGCRVAAVAAENNQLHAVSDPRGEGLSFGE